MKDKIMIFFISVILLSGCGFEKLGEWDISELYAQKIEGTSKIYTNTMLGEEEIRTLVDL